MFLMHQDAKYFDVAEIALLNNSLAGVNHEGNKFFYVNPLEVDGETEFNHGSSGRCPWFDTACCPSNMARLVPQVSGYMYAHSQDEVFLLLYGQSETSVVVGGVTVQLSQKTGYPFDGKISITVVPESDADFGIKLRIPTWVGSQFVPGALYSYTGQGEQWTLSVNGESVEDSKCLARLLGILFGLYGSDGDE